MLTLLAWLGGIIAAFLIFASPFIIIGFIVRKFMCRNKPSRMRKVKRGRGAPASTIPADQKEIPADRLFTSKQKDIGHARAGHVCEYTDEQTKVRCSRPSWEGDHFYPYSRGGATTLMNFVSACTYHNQKKSAQIWEADKPAIEHRRNDYFPRDEKGEFIYPITVGEWK